MSVNYVIIGSDNGLSPASCEAVIYTQCWHIDNWIHANKFHWNLNQNEAIFILEKAFENLVCKKVAILF